MINLHVYVTSKFISANGLKWIDSEEFDLNNYTKNISKGCVLEIDLGYPKESHNDYH